MAMALQVLYCSYMPAYDTHTIMAGVKRRAPPADCHRHLVAQHPLSLAGQERPAPTCHSELSSRMILVSGPKCDWQSAAPLRAL